MDGMNFSRNRGTRIPRRTKRQIYTYIKEFLRARHLERINIRCTRWKIEQPCDELQNKYRHQDKNRSSFRRGSVVFTVINSEDIAGVTARVSFFSRTKREIMDPRREDVDESVGKEKSLTFFRGLLYGWTRRTLS